MEEETEDQRGPTPAQVTLRRGCVSQESRLADFEAGILSSPASMRGSVSSIPHPRKKNKRLQHMAPSRAAKEDTFIYDNRLAKIKTASGRSRSLMN